MGFSQTRAQGLVTLHRIPAMQPSCGDRAVGEVYPGDWCVYPGIVWPQGDIWSNIEVIPSSQPTLGGIFPPPNPPWEAYSSLSGRSWEAYSSLFGRSWEAF